MKIPQEIADKVSEYEKVSKKANALYKEIVKYFRENTDMEGYDEPFIADKPSGEKQFDGEYCDQVTLGEDWYQGTYYWPIEGRKQYVGFTYEI